MGYQRSNVTGSSFLLDKICSLFEPATPRMCSMLKSVKHAGEREQARKHPIDLFPPVNPFKHIIGIKHQKL